MASTLRDYTAGLKISSGTGTVDLPALTEAGDLLFLFCHDGSYLDVDNKPTGSGWKYHSGQGWSKRATAADVTAGSVSVSGMTFFLVAFTGAGKVGNVATGSAGCKMSTAGSGLLVVGTGGALSLTTLTPATGKLGSDLLSHPKNDRLHAIWWLPQTTTGYKAISPTQDVNYDAFEIVPLAGPSAPTLLSPTGSVHVDRAAEVPLRWRHNSNQDEPQDAYQARIRQVSTSTWYFVLADGSLSVTETTITSADPLAAVAAATLTSSTVYEWQARTQELGTWSAWSASAQLTAMAAPTVDSVTVSSPTEDLSPTITATVTIASGSQTAWQSRIKQGSAVVWDSGITTGSALSTIVPARDDWDNGASLTAEWRVSQTGGLWSSWVASSAFSVSWTAPTAPSAVTAANQASGPLRVTVAGITAGYDLVQVESSTDNFATSTAVAEFVPDATSEVVDVPQAPYGTVTKYRARVANTVDGVLLWSAWTATAAGLASTDTGAYLIADDFSSYLAVRVADEDRWMPQGVAVMYPVGSESARVDMSATAGWAGRVLLTIRTQAEVDAIIAFLLANKVFRIRWNAERAGSTYADYPAMRVARASELHPQRLAKVAIQNRTLPVDWVQQ